MALYDLSPQPADPLLALIAAFQADPRSDTLDLGVGVFRDGRGRTPVMAAIKEAEARLLATQDSKSYLGPEGDKSFVARLAPIVLGEKLASHRAAGMQTPGGTGALRLCAELLAKAGIGRIWIAAPSWLNHAPVFAHAGIAPQLFDGFDIPAQELDGQALLGALEQACQGDAVLLHGCCHNPTGIDPDPTLWEAIADLVATRSLVPLIDLAYQGLGDGLEEDAAGARMVLSRCDYGLLAYSCDKNFGLYRERTGALWAIAPDTDRATPLLSNLLSLARTNWSMPPDHGAAAVRIVLEDPELEMLWRRELEQMRLRLAYLRSTIACHGRIGAVDLAPLTHGKGLFATLPLDREQIALLREQHGIYMPSSGRINIGGFNETGITHFAAALAQLSPAHAS